MALIEKELIDKIEVLDNNCIQIRKATIIEKDGEEIAKTYHRHVINPGDELTNEDAKVQAIANSIWTEEIILSFQQAQTEALKNK